MNKKILIAEDEKPLAMALDIKLKKAGYESLAVFNGQDALNSLESGTFDLLLLDLMMPVMDGWSVLDKVKTSYPKMKIIITSNLSQPEDIKKAKDHGADDYIVKSDSSIADIVSKVDNLLK